MRPRLLLVLCAIVSFSASAQTFPQTWQGTWRGTLRIHTAKGIAQTVPMAVEIAPTADSLRWRFALMYGEDTVKGRRAYELVVLNRATGHYQFDEKNSIRLDAYLMTGRLLSAFTVQGTRLISTYERRGDELIFEIISGKDAPVGTTGGQKVGDEDIPLVQSFPIGTWHRAVLKRQ